MHIILQRTDSLSKVHTNTPLYTEITRKLNIIYINKINYRSKLGHESYNNYIRIIILNR
jgi:hypothetical protein